MAFEPRDLSILAYANGFTLWHYGTKDKSRDVSGKGYFDGAHELIEAGDMIMTSLGDSGARSRAAIFLVAANRDGSIAVDEIGGASGANGKANR